MNNDKKSVNISIRVSEEEKEKIKELAKEEYRTVSNYILNLVKEDIERKQNNNIDNV
ncbi:plasmid mobilization protein [Peptoniphilus obesi]|uniref:plasmid mobilization protein n=1 Tax=Peptoniphilus obesi TaxID=1472765 RepID=UPI0037093E57